MDLCGRQKVVRRKMVLLGDGACGKTSALNVFTRGLVTSRTLACSVYNFADLSLDTSQQFKNYVHDIFVDNVHMELSLWDTAGQEEFDRLRALSYEDTHVIMLCFSVDSPDSFENVASKWIEEITENCPGVRMVLTALKCDLRKDEFLNDNPNAITYEQGLAKAKEIGAVKYLECSAVQNRGIMETFYEAAKVALDVKAQNSGASRSGCVIV
ncbi:Rho GTPase Rho3 [Aspergillus rambellii]|uniref:GTP-binding protein RHO3 n=2 Tax=Aspergillus subgen. Nidulantes TaxID=2720870 RepID=A0A0F8WF43_9EURO|nr:Rho GTPase Rho3 [Aspergillus rambellii]KKK23842.1 Rho GTPase Rho3 [Aspergillus ochraceoroseus]